MPREKRSELEKREVKPKETITPAVSEFARRRGGFRKPFTIRGFVTDHLSEVGEDCISGMHRTYKARLDEAGRWRRCKKPTYNSFRGAIWKLKKEGLIKFTRAEETRGKFDNFNNFSSLPELHYFKLA